MSPLSPETPLSNKRSGASCRLNLSKLRRIAVFRALFLGDMLCCVPALRALRRAAPVANLVLVGLPWAHDFARRFSHYIDEFIEFPGYPGLPEQSVDQDRIEQFRRSMSGRQFDLAIQLHGSGKHSNRACQLFGAKHTAGFFLPGEPCPDAATHLAYPVNEPEIRRHLRLMEFLGAEPCGDDLEFPVHSTDVCALRALCSSAKLPYVPYICIHPGAKLASRRWPTARFADVANRLGGRGYFIVVTGGPQERALCDALCSLIHVPHKNLSARTDLGTLAAALKFARLVITNDTGVSHLAVAVQTPSVVIFLGSDPARWSPLDQRRHRVVKGEVPCRPCEHPVCPIGFVCADAVTPDAVVARAMEAMSLGARKARLQDVVPQQTSHSAFCGSA